LGVIEPFAKKAKNAALQRIASFLRSVDPAEVSSAEAFATALMSEVKLAYEGTWASKVVEKVVKSTTKAIYSFFRLKDSTAFGGEKPPVTLKFGGPDEAAIEFFGKFDGYYFSKYVDNSSDALQKFFREEYLDKGGSLFKYGESTEYLNDFRKAAGGMLDKVNDRGVDTIISSSVQRIRNYAHINSLQQAGFEYMRVVAIIDEKTSEICLFLNGKLIKVDTASKAIERLTELSPGDYANELYYSALGKAFARDGVNYVKERVDEDGLIDDELVSEGRGFPPYHPRCRTGVEGVFAE
jgi:SPP1 gp7 family putative phage head morphogenesis protein